LTTLPDDFLKTKKRLNFVFSGTQNQPLLMNKSIEDEVTELLEKSNLIENLSKKKFVSMFVLAQIASRSVQFYEVSLHVNADAKPESTERRIQSFFKDFSFDYDKICAFMLLFLP
jgi:hypothetical protein